MGTRYFYRYYFNHFNFRTLIQTESKTSLSITNSKEFEISIKENVGLVFREYSLLCLLALVKYKSIF